MFKEEIHKKLGNEGRMSIHEKLESLENNGEFTERFFLDFFNSSEERIIVNDSSDLAELQSSEEDMEEEIETLVDELYDNFGLVRMKRGDINENVGSCFHLKGIGDLDITMQEGSEKQRLRIRLVELSTNCPAGLIYIGYIDYSTEDKELEDWCIQDKVYAYQSEEELRPYFEEVMEDLQHSSDDLDFDDEDE